MKRSYFYKWIFFLSMILLVSSCFKEDLVSDEARRIKEEQDLEAYLEENEITVEPTESGLYYIEVKRGIGIQPDSGDVASILYSTRKLAGGNILDERLYFPVPIRIGNGEVVAGVDEGLRLMKKGGIATLIIPSHLAYGANGYGSIIGPYTTLIMDVQLVDVSGK